MGIHHTAFGLIQTVIERVGHAPATLVAVYATDSQPIALFRQTGVASDAISWADSVALVVRTERKDSLDVAQQLGGGVRLAQGGVVGILVVRSNGQPGQWNHQQALAAAQQHGLRVGLTI